MCEGRGLLQFSPTGSHSTEELASAGCLYPIAKKHWRQSASMDAKMHHRQLKSLCCQMQNLKLCRQHSPPHKPCLADCPQEFLLLPQDHTPPGRGPQQLHTIHNQTEEPAAISEKNQKGQHTAYASETFCPCCDCAPRWRGWGAGVGAGGLRLFTAAGAAAAQLSTGRWASCTTPALQSGT